MVMLGAEQSGRLVYDALPIPICILTDEGRLVGMNPAAERFWGARLADVGGTLAAEVLGIRSLEEDAVPGADPLTRAVAGGVERLPCRITGRDGRTHVCALVGALSMTDNARFAVVGVVAERPAVDGSAPAWALTDPVTGLANRNCWERARERWAAIAGAVVLLDLDDLKGINDLYGHPVGDRMLRLVGDVVRGVQPPESLAVRFGGDEFLILLPGAGEQAAEALAMRVRDEVGSRAGADTPPELSHGVSAFVEGGLDAAIRHADESLYERKGVLLRAGSGGRLVLTRGGQRMLRGPGEDRDTSSDAGQYAGQFSREFDAHFRAIPSLP